MTTSSVCTTARRLGAADCDNSSFLDSAHFFPCFRRFRVFKNQRHQQGERKASRTAKRRKRREVGPSLAEVVRLVVQISKIPGESFRHLRSVDFTPVSADCS